MQMWFAAGQDVGGSNEVLARIDAYIPSAFFFSRPKLSSGISPSNAGACLLLEYNPSAAVGALTAMRQTLSPELLADMVRGSLLSLKDTGTTARQTEVLDNFVHAYYAAVEVHVQHLHLEAIGHPDFCNGCDEVMNQGINVRKFDLFFVLYLVNLPRKSCCANYNRHLH